MLERLSLNDFQRWEELEVEFDPKVTTLVGPTDRGKSSTLRALRWLLLNKAPKGDFVKWGESGCAVSAFIDGKWVSRVRDADGNRYGLGTQVYKAVGLDVPPAIAKFLNVTEVNFHRQHDPLFWLSDTPGEVAKSLNKIVNLTLVDASLANVNKEVKNAKQASDVAEERLQQLTAEMKSLAWVQNVDVQLRRVEGLAASLASHRDKLARLQLLVAQATNHNKTLGVADKATTKARKRLEGLHTLAAAIKAQRTRVAGLVYAVAAASQHKERICHLETQLRSGRSELKRMIGDQCPLCKQPVTSRVSGSGTSTPASNRR